MVYQFSEAAVKQLMGRRNYYVMPANVLKSYLDGAGVIDGNNTRWAYRSEDAWCFNIKKDLPCPINPADTIPAGGVTLQQYSGRSQAEIDAAFALLDEYWESVGVLVLDPL